MNSLPSKIKSNKWFKLKILALIPIAFAGYYAITANSPFHQNKILHQARTNLSVCLGRVSQTLTAKLIGDAQSIYLGNDFFAMTEECFSEVQQSVNQIVSTTTYDIGQELSTIITEVYNFNRKAAGEIKTLTDNSSNFETISKKFEKIEENVNLQLDSLDSFLIKLDEQVDAKLMKASALSLVSFLIFIMILWTEKKQKLKLVELEKQAEIELLKDGQELNSSTVDTIISQALKSGDFESCSMLFEKYHTGLLEGSIPVYISKDSDQTSKNSTNSNIELLRKNTLGNIDNLSPVNLDQILTNVLKGLSEQIFSKGIILSVDVHEEILVYAKEEALAQALHNVLSFSMKSCSANQLTRTIRVQGKNLGGMTVLEVVDSGAGFPKEWITKNLGPDVIKNIDLELKISAKLVEELHGEMALLQSRNSAGDIQGGKIRLILNRVQTQSRKIEVKDSKLIKLMKGSKREIVEQIKGQA